MLAHGHRVYALDVASLRGGRTGTRRVGIAWACVVLLVGCATTADGSDSLVPPGILARLDAWCDGPETPGLGGGTLCIDNGFRLNRDDFSFPNWGRSSGADGNVTVQTLVDLFGSDAVCSDVSPGSCTPRPAAMQMAEEWNNALSGGRCEGMAAMSVLFHLGLDEPGTWGEDAVDTADLEADDPVLQSGLVYWWATQFTPEVASRAAASRSRAPLALVEELVRALADDSGMTLGLYAEGAGHAVVPFAVTRRDDSFVVHVADNNAPGERREVLVDRNGTWSYPRAARNGDGSWREWGGGLGTFELTPVSARRGPFTCPRCGDAPSTDDGATTVVTLASRDPLAPGRLLVATDEGTVTPGADGPVGIEGARVLTTKGGESMVEVEVPAGAGDVRVSVLPVDGRRVPGDVVLTVRRAGGPSVLLAGDLVREPDDAGPAVVLSDDRIVVSAPDDAPARVSIADGTRLVRTDLPGSHSLVVTGGRDEELVVDVIDAEGRPVGRSALGPTPAKGTTLTVLDRGPDGLRATSRPADPVRIGAGSGNGPTVPTTEPPTIEVTAPD